MRYAEIVSGLLSVLLGMAIILATRSFPALPTADVGPAFFPKVVGILFISFGALLAIVSFWNKETRIQLSEIFNRRSLLALGTIIIFGLYVFIVRLLGFLISTPLLIIGLAIFLKGKSKIMIVLVGIIVTILIYYLFLKFLLIPLPKGIFF